MITPARAVGGASAVSSTTNIGWPTGNGACLNGGGSGDPINCNHYSAKEDVWLSGLPGHISLPTGDYYFAVLSPGGQSDPVDGAADNLSSPNDPVTDRTFTITDGTITYAGPHQFDAVNGKIQLADYDDTTNNGGVYILAVCSVETGLCKFDAFKVDPGTGVGGSGGIAAEKTATATHTRTVSWTIQKLVDGKSSEAFNQAGPATLNYSVAVTKTAVDTYGVSGTITVTNTTENPVTVTVEDTGLVPAVTGSTCQLASTDPLVVGAIDPISLDPGQNSVDYTCSFTAASPPDPTTNYTNTATVSYELDGPQSLPIASDPFTFPDATLTAGSAPETITVSDPNAPLAAGFPKTASDTTTWTYTRTIFNNNCATYPNTATINETGQYSGTSVVFCGPNSGGLTMGWWQNKNGQTLLKSNLAAACTTVNGYLPVAPLTATALNYLPDAYQQNASFKTAAYQYVQAQCTTSSAKSYLPTFDLNVFTAANASGTGTMMVEGQWLTTALDTANYTVSTSAGKPTLQGTQKVLVPAALQSGLGLSACDSVANLLTTSAAQYSAYSASKTLNVTPALITLLNAINNNLAITCQ